MIACAEIKGFAMETQSNKQLARSLDEAVDPSDPDFNRVSSNGRGIMNL